jgi:hypothetical protein
LGQFEIIRFFRMRKDLSLLRLKKHLPKPRRIKVCERPLRQPNVGYKVHRRYAMAKIAVQRMDADTRINAKARRRDQRCSFTAPLSENR